MADYCTLAQIIAEAPGSMLASTDTTTDFDAAVESILPSVSRAIDKAVGKWDNYFSPTTDGETRYFDGSGEVEQDIDECVSLTTVKVSEEGGTSSTDYTSWTEDTDFYTWPYNYTAEAEPIKRLVIDFNGDQLTWTRYRKAVQVTGIFGWALTVPDDVERAAIIQAVRWYMRAKQYYQQQGGNAAIAVQETRAGMDPEAELLLLPYKVKAMR